MVFNGLFSGDTNLTDASRLLLPDTTLTKRCYATMFDGCSRLTTAPELPATALDTACYYGMFYNCASLTTGPELPATKLRGRCYSAMFGGCTGLTIAPELPAPALVFECYSSMFSFCSNLSSVTCLATDGISTTNCSWWLYNAGTSVVGTKTFYKALSATWTTSSDSGIPSGWTVENAQQ